MRHLMSPLDFTTDELDRLLDLANDIENNPQKYAKACEGKKLATAFYEPSTRTRVLRLIMFPTMTVQKVIYSLCRASASFRDAG